MISVPVEVKKALKKGRSKKEYRIEVYQNTTEIVSSLDYMTELDVTDNPSFTVFASGTYRFYHPTVNTSFTYTLTDSGGTTKTYSVVAQAGQIGTHHEFSISEEMEVTLTASNVALELQYKNETEVAYDAYQFTIDNDNLVAESVKIDERMCSDKTIKFGLCEGSSLEFQYFGFSNINGKLLKVFLDVNYIDGNGDPAVYSIPMGSFEVDQCPMQFSTGIYKVTAYNKLKSKYLDQKANNLLLTNYVNKNLGITFFDIKRTLLSDFQIDMSVGIAQQDPVTWVLFTDPQSGTGVSKAYKQKTFASGSQTSWFNICMAGGSATSTSSYKPILEAELRSWDLDPDKAYCIDSYYNMDELEQIYYSQISSDLSKSGIKDPSAIMTGWIKNTTLGLLTPSGYPTNVTGWANLFGVILIKPDDTWDYYSGIGYSNSRPNCKGTASDLTHKLITGYKKMWLCLPFGEGFFNNDNSNVFTEDVPFDFWVSAGVYGEGSAPRIKDADGRDIEIYVGGNFNHLFFQVKELSGLSSADMIEINPSDLEEFTLRDIVNATYETVAQYGKLDRETDLFSGVELNGGELYPALTLYPANNLFPNGNTGGEAIHPFPSEYQKLWTDAVGMQNFRYLRITYKTLVEGEEIEKVLQRTVNTHGTTDYNMSDNWIFRNMIWTSEDVGVYADAMAQKMKDISWFPYEMWAAGLPYVETGDAIEITDREGNTYTSYILQRQLNGIHNLQDTMINGELDVF